VSKDVQDIIRRRPTCQAAKSHSLPQGLYTPLPMHKGPWTYVSINFILALRRTNGGKDLVFMVINRFSKMAHFIACTKTNDVVLVTELYFKR